MGVETKTKAGAKKPDVHPNTWVYFEGEFARYHDVKLGLMTHALHYGTACFEGIRAYWNARHEQLYLLKLREHYERMARSWNVLRMRPQESIDDLCSITVELVRKNGYHQDVYVRPITYKASLTIKL